MIWFTSDTHFGHENVLKFTDRPWETIWQMNDAIADNINGKVAVDDELYILGDFSFKMTAQDAYGLRKRIACRRIHLVPGNHDKDWTQPAVAAAFTVEPPICVLKIDGQKIVLSHYPMADWQGMSHDRGTSTDTSTAAAARTTSSTASRAFCATTSVAMPTGTPR